MEWRVPDGDESGTWKKGWGGPLPRLEQDWGRAYAASAMGCFDAIGAFTCQLDGYEVIEGWPYERVPVVPEAEVAARRAAWGARGDACIGTGTDLWCREIQPEVESLLTDVRRRRPRRKSLPGLVAHVERCMEAAAHVMGELHWRCIFGWTSDWDTAYPQLTGDDPAGAAVFVQGIDHMTSRLVRRLRDLARLRNEGRADAYEAAFAELLRRYGRRTGRGFGSSAGFRDGTWSMDPEAVHELVATYGRADLDRLDERERAAKRARQAAVRKLRRRFEGTEVWPALDLAHQAAGHRVRGMENHNHFMEQETEGTLREAIHRLGLALVAAGRLDAPDDVFHFGLDELREAAKTAGDLRTTVAERVAELEAQRRLVPPEFLGAAPSAPPGRPAVPGWEEASAIEEHPPGVLVGTPASPGVASGRAVVVGDSPWPPDVEPGDIVVARDAGPGWTPIFALLGGLVLDEGWAIQHAAIVCREYGIPCVLGTKSATSTIPAGAMVTVDGTLGRVEIAP